MLQTIFADQLVSLSSQDLLALKAQIDQQLQNIYDLKENFFTHETTDDYIYIVTYLDGHDHIDYIGARAYKEYIDNVDAIRIDRKTKDLFPKYEILLEKEMVKA